jgi:hypothetical protein
MLEQRGEENKDELVTVRCVFVCCFYAESVRVKKIIASWSLVLCSS